MPSTRSLSSPGVTQLSPDSASRWPRRAPALYVAASMVMLLATAATAAAQARVEGTVRWRDGSPADGVTVAITAVGTTTTDAAGGYRFEGVRLGTRATLTVVLDGRALTRASRPISLPVEVIDLDLPGNADTRGVVSDVAMATDTITFAADGTPIVSSEVTVAVTLPMLSASTEAGKVRLSPEQVSTLPSLGARDLFRALQWLPGISSNETSSGLYVRGGTPDQNLVDYDGFTVYSVDHLFGYFSAFNMDAVESVEVSKGAYEARFGGRLASVTEVRSKSRPEAWQGSAGASFLSADGVLARPIGSAASFLVAYRQSYQTPLYDRILGLVNNPGGPGGPGGGRFASVFSSQPRSSFDDMNGRFELRPSNRDQLAVTLYRGDDDVDNSRELQLPGEVAERLAARGLSVDGISITDVRDYRNTGVSARWNREWSPRIRSMLTVGRSDYDALTQRSSTIGDRQGGTGELNVVDDSTFTFHVPVAFTPSQELSMGVQHTRHRVGYRFANTLAPPSGATTPATPPLSQLDRTTTGDVLSWYAQHRLSIGNRVFAVPGVRAVRFSTTGERYLEPRISATALLTDTLRLKGAWGQYHQFANQLVREDVLQGNRQFWTLSDGGAVPVSASTNMALGATYETTGLLIDAEVFARDLSGLTQLAPRLFGGTADVDLSQFYYYGTGRSTGLELLAQRRAGRHNALASYTLSRVTYDFPDLGEPFAADHDRTHELKLVDTVVLGSWTLSGTWVYSTGRPYTEPIGTESVAGPFGNFAIERIVVGQRNGSRLAPYHRLDVAASYSWRFAGNRSAVLSASAFNAYNRANVWYKEFTTFEGEIVENNIGLMGRTLNASLSIRF